MPPLKRRKKKKRSPKRGKAVEKRERAIKINQQAMQTDVDRITEWAGLGRCR